MAQETPAPAEALPLAAVQPEPIKPEPTTPEAAASTPAAPEASPISDDTRKRVLDELTPTELKKLKAFRVAKGEDVQASIDRGVERALAQREADARQRELAGLPPEQRWLALGRQAEEKERETALAQKAIAALSDQIGAALKGYRGLDEETVETLFAKPDVPSFIRAFGDMMYDRAKSDPAVRKAIREEMLAESRKGEPSPRLVPQGTVSGKAVPTLAEVKKMSAQDFLTWEKENPDTARQLYERVDSLATG